MLDDCSNPELLGKQLHQAHCVASLFLIQCYVLNILVWQSALSAESYFSKLISSINILILFCCSATYNAVH